MRRLTFVRRSFPLLFLVFLFFWLAGSRAIAAEPDEQQYGAPSRAAPVSADSRPMVAPSPGLSAPEVRGKLGSATFVTPRALARPAEAIQATDQLVLHCEGTLDGEGGETPLTESGVTYEAGISGSGAYFAPGNQVYYSDTGNIDATDGSMSFWVKPRWNGGDGVSHCMLSYGGAGGILIEKDSANNLKIVVNRSATETVAFVNISSWAPNAWHHVACTWSNSAVQLYVDAVLRAQATPPGALPSVSSSLQIGADNAADALDGVLDEVRIAQGVRTSIEIQSEYHMIIPAAAAQWTTNGIPLVTGAGDQTLGASAMVSDGAGGAIVAWEQSLSGVYDIYAQHILSSGAVDPVWPAGGVLVCSASGDQRTPALCRDAGSGALVTWSDTRSGAADIYVQHVLGSGVLDPVWAANGTVLCAATDDQLRPTIVADGFGGGVVVWNDHRSGNYDIYAGRVLSWGAVDAIWPVDGTAVCTAANDQHNNSCQVVTDGVGGAIAVWEDLRNGANGVDIYMQRIQLNGVVGGDFWPVNGLAVVGATGNQTSPFLVDDGRPGPRGAVVTWRDARSGFTDIYVQHVNVGGQNALGPNGLLACNNAGDQVADGIVLEEPGSGNPSTFRSAILVWRDYRFGPNPAPFARRLQTATTFDPAWPTTGLQLGSTMSATQGGVAVAGDGAGGAIVAWSQLEAGSEGILAQHVKVGGVLSAPWTPSGELVSSGNGPTLPATMVADGSGGAIVAWNDYRDLTDFDVYAQRIAADHLITASPGSHGSISPQGTVSVPRGTNQAYSITPIPSYYILDVKVDGVSVGTSSNYMFSNVSAGHTISATFATQINPIFETTDSLAVLQHGFDTPSGACALRGWTGQDRAGLVFSHVSTRFVQNGVTLNGGYVVNMGTQALWVGADDTSAPDEVKNWVGGYGFGNEWSQRIVSPSFSTVTYPNAKLTFDAMIEQEANGPITATIVPQTELFAVQGLMSNGKWVALTSRFTTASGLITSKFVTGRGVFHCEVRTGEDNNNLLGLASNTKLRLVVQSSSFNSNEDGGLPLGQGLAVIDGLQITNVPDDAVIVPLVDFQDGTTGPWTLEACNGNLAPAVIAIRDVSLPNSQPDVVSGFDFTDPSCVWKFTSPSGYMEAGTYIFLVSPWFPTYQNPNGLLVQFSGKLSTPNTNRRLWQSSFRGKNIGDTRPRMVARGTTLFFNPSTDDNSAALITVTSPNPVTLTTFPSGASSLTDSTQIVLRIINRPEAGFTGLPLSRFPYIDDIEVNLLGADSDYDGVANAVDGCPTVNAAGQDANGDGCIDEGATLRHVESWAAGPVRYALSTNGDPRITDGSDLDEVRAGFQVWEGVPGSSLDLQEEPVSSVQNSSSMDGLNLITFQDSHVSLPPSVIAVTPTTSFTRRKAYHDQTRLPGEIVDADLIFNRTSTFGTPSYNAGTGSFDLRSVTAHEAGHFLGLSHSGVLDATMFFVLQPSQDAASLEDDDRAAIAEAYPGPTLSTDFGTITGKVRRGLTLAVVPGALVTAVRLSGGVPADTASSDYSSEDGSFALRRLPPGDYAVRLTPLDGEVGGLPLTPSYISARVEAVAQTDFEAEWWDSGESESDNPTTFTPITIAAGETVANRDVITNVDVTPPTMASVDPMFPVDDATQVRIDSAVLVNFSERIQASTLQGNFKLHVAGNHPSIGGNGVLINGGRTYVFTPIPALEFNTAYEIEVLGGVKDLRGVNFSPPFLSSFSTETRPTVAIADLQPRSASEGSFVTIVGAGFDPTVTNTVGFTFCQTCTPVAVTASSVTPSSLVAKVPAGAATGGVTVGVGAETSNPFTLTVLPASPQVAPSLTDRINLPAGFSPTDVAIAPDGLTLYAVGDGGLATINLDSGRPNFRTPVVVAMAGARRLALSPDGYRAYVTRRDLGEVAVVDADPFSGQYRTILAHVTVGDGQGRPEGVALGNSGRRAYVTDASSGTIYELDTAAGSLTRNQVLREVSDPGLTLTGGVVVLPGSSRLLFTTGNEGSRSYDLSSGVASVLTGQPSTGAVAATPSGEEMLYLGAGPSAGSVLFAGQGGGPSQPGSITLGGALRDIEVNPQGRSAFVVNAAFNQLQIVDVDPSSATYHTKVAEAPTGRNPSAVALSADGSTIVVAEEGGSSVAMFGTGTAGQIVRLTPPTVVAGGAVSIAFTSGFHPAGSQVAPGLDTPIAFSHLAPPAASAAAFIAPSSLLQDDRALTVLDSGGARMLAASFRVVDPISGLAPQATGLDLTLAPTSCAPGAMDGVLLVRASHAGRLLAVGRFGECDVRLEIHRISAGAGETFGERLVSTVLPSSPTAIGDLAFTPDDRNVWFCLDGLLYAMDADPSSPTFGVVTAVPGLSGGQLARAVAADPMGRSMIVGTSNGDVTFWNPLSQALGTTLSTPAAIASLAASPDGRYAIAGSLEQAVVLSLDAPAVVATTSAHSGAGNVKSVVVTDDARYAVGLFDNDRLGVWDLSTDPSFTESTIDLSSYGFTSATQVLPEPDPASVMVGSAASAALLHVPLAGGSVATVAMPHQARALARSLDGRQLWVGDWEGGPASGVVRLFSLSHASAMALVSGADQAALPGATLPNPVRVRVVDAQASPQAGVVVRFEASQGTLDGQGGTVRRITDVNGEAQALWTLPSSPGSPTVTATALGVSGGVIAIPAEAAASDQQIAPQVVEFGPQGGATGINIGTPMLIRFNQRMNQTSVTSRLSLATGLSAVAFDLSFDEDGRFLSIQPTVPLPFGTTCVLSVAAGALDQDGQAMASGASATFTTQTQPPLALASVYPPSAKVGDQVVLTGRGFSLVPSQNVVLFNDVLANVTSSSFEELRVNVPSGATTGAVRVTIGSVTSNPANFTVAVPAPVMQTEGTVPLRRGVRHIAVTPDGQRAYVTNPRLSTVTVLTLNPAAPLTTITVGLSPTGIAMTPDGTRAYVANTGSNDVSVIDTDPASSNYNLVVARIPVSRQPTAVAVSVIGPQVLVVSADEEGTVSFIDADPGDGAYHQVTSKTKTGSGGTSVAITADGTRAFVLTTAGELVVMDLSPGSPTRNQVTSKTKTGSGGTSVAISADGTILLVLLGSGDLLGIDITPGSATQNQVVSKTKSGSGGTSVAISADGGTAFVSNGIDILRFQIQLGSGNSGSTLVPGATLTLTQEATMTVGDSPADVIFDPHDQRAYVANEGSGTLTVLAAPGVADVPLAPLKGPATALEWAGPMPAHGEARLRFALPRAADVRVEILDIAGRRVRVLAQGRQEPGWHLVHWNGASEAGDQVASGIYFVRMASERTRLHLKLIWLR
jgi:YVTN family beta-propeller protein